MVKKKQKRGHGNKWKWYTHYAHPFFYIAHLALQYLNDPDKKYSRAIGSEQELPSLKYKKTDIIVPIIYNIKHGIELFLKGVMKNLNIPLPHQEKNTKKDCGHNIDYLYKKITTSKIVKKHKDLQNQLKSLGGVLCKFNKSVSKNDYKNLYYKYPEDKNGLITLTAADLKIISTKKYLKGLKKDLEILYIGFNKIGSIICDLKNRK